MMKLAILSSLIASAAAFAPTQSKSASVALDAKADFANEIGAMTPLGLFDPMGFLTNADQAQFDDYRAKEIKHGRVGTLMLKWLLSHFHFVSISICGTNRIQKTHRLCSTFFASTAMLGVVGYLTTYAGVRFPGLEDVPAGWAAWNALPAEVVSQMGMTWIFMEMANRDQTGNAKIVGDFRNGYLDFGWDDQSEAWQTKKRTIELNQGRAAMMGLFGLMVHDSMGNIADILPLAK